MGAKKFLEMFDLYGAFIQATEMDKSAKDKLIDEVPF